MKTDDFTPAFSSGHLLFYFDSGSSPLDAAPVGWAGVGGGGGGLGPLSWMRVSRGRTPVSRVLVWALGRTAR